MCGYAEIDDFLVDEVADMCVSVLFSLGCGCA